MKVHSAAILVVALSERVTRTISPFAVVENSELQTRVAKLTEELRQQEYALQMPDMVKGGVITVTVLQ